MAEGTRTTERAFVSVGARSPWRGFWSDVLLDLDHIGHRNFAELSLVTEKELIHDWRPESSLGGTSPLRPAPLGGWWFLGIDEADERILITLERSCSGTAVGSGFEMGEL